jgi:hypothetical protein
MKSTPDRDLLVLFKNEFMSQQAIDQEVDCLNKILRRTDLPHEFCRAHELVRRNRITQKTEKLLYAFRQPLLKTVLVPHRQKLTTKLLSLSELIS